VQRGRQNSKQSAWRKKDKKMQSIQVVPNSGHDIVLSTTQKDLILGLLMLGHKPVGVRSDGRTATYDFDGPASEDAARILRNENITVSLKEVFNANILWAATLTRAAELSRQLSA